MREKWAEHVIAGTSLLLENWLGGDLPSPMVRSPLTSHFLITIEL